MTYLAAVLVAACFAIALRALGLVPVAVKAIRTAGHATQSMRDPTLSEAVKERAVRQASLSLMGNFLSIVLRAAVALAVSLLPLIAFHTAGLAPWSSVTHLLVTWQGMLLASAVMVVAYSVRSQ